MIRLIAITEIVIVTNRFLNSYSAVIMPKQPSEEIRHLKGKQVRIELDDGL